jgi:hypothetical protein
MKKIILITLNSLGLALVWAAGHDILNGETDVRAEYATIIVGLVLALFELVVFIRKMRFGGRG